MSSCARASSHMDRSFWGYKKLRNSNKPTKLMLLNVPGKNNRKLKHTGKIISKMSVVTQLLDVKPHINTLPWELTLCARRDLPSQASVTSVNDSDCSKRSKARSKFD
ncbi:hypothetical protein E2C01_013182 [Portunus trituberculatus]|uniref:Uncharacterized protein n=1 Tax=Portunus trituberculatus TaxID=210409 RepID=A0A5B7DGL5_PORTR|nr:hypothetical protein [Portunus trituberculatus]